MASVNAKKDKVRMNYLIRFNNFLLPNKSQ